ncbi:hypothetical protein [Pseudobutyrivibrio sp.]|uniref:hypothetical protein n=1 Tax=Pseudobutyrivibrio sp. TaxID=2014367 RepID=UPI001D95E3BF|nr:hypothetical protein [Pseudobutyrivibrio sp.]MBE5912026.1 hypothetical protein [Pseudobutyrivibrio sp.]
MGEKKVTIYESDGEAIKNGRIFNQVKGYAYIDEDKGEVTFTDTPAPFAKIKDRAYFNVEKMSGSKGIAPENTGDLVVFGIMLVVILMFIIAIPISWKQLFEDYSEFPLEASLMVGVAIISMIVAYFKGFKMGVLTSAILGTLTAIIMDGFSWWFVFFMPIIDAGFGVIPSAIGFVIRKIRNRLNKK